MIPIALPCTDVPTRPPAILKITHDALTSDEQRADVQRIDPVIGADLPAGRYVELAKPHFERTDVWLAPSEVGTTLAHLAAYEHILHTQRGAIILEADITLDTPTLDTLRRVVQSHDVPFIMLGYYEAAARKSIRRVRSHPSGLLLRDPKQRFEGAFAYYASPTMASTLRDFHAREFRLADAWTEVFAEHDVEPLYLPLVAHGSATGANRGAREARGSHWTILRRLAVRARHYLTFRWFTSTARLRGWQPDACDATPTVRTWRGAATSSTEPQGSSREVQVPPESQVEIERERDGTPRR